ncbi:phosphatase PAP2 family protein [Streptomyces sp. ISL-11]|uniref:phosphatase PAP2 family protein n=1 Tax=Streptomyces sp. ISL-11 TaxID=2819174 RepID=UPI001BEB6A93|nr:phosphatase PAP2 family protein [Streptomyces sp. ISL-11]MBT2387298.1 phosphatase PAP2 family protein [Streptomyces sp. ISL-11]
MKASAFDGSGVDGSVYLDVTRLAGRSPHWLDSLVTAWSAYGLALFALLMVVAWWQARRRPGGRAVGALAAPVIVVAAFGVSALAKLVVREDRPCHSLHVLTLEACPAPGDWSFPSNHATLAAAAAVALLFASRRLGMIAMIAALLMAVSRVWVGAHYPHDAAAGLLVGALVALPLAAAVRRSEHALAARLESGRLRILLAVS